MELVKKEKGIIAASYAQEAIYIKFKDSVELTIPCEGEAGRINRILTMLRNSPNDAIVLDLTNKDNPISFG